MLSVVILSVVMLSVIMLSVVLLSVDMLSVVMLSVVMLSVVMLSVVVLSVVKLSVIILRVVAPLVILASWQHCLYWQTLEESQSTNRKRFSDRNGTAHFKKCKQLFEYKHILLLRDIWWSKF